MSLPAEFITEENQPQAGVWGGGCGGSLWDGAYTPPVVRTGWRRLWHELTGRLERAWYELTGRLERAWYELTLSEADSEQRDY